MSDRAKLSILFLIAGFAAPSQLVARGNVHAVDAPPQHARYPYERAYLPVNRKLDGTIHSW